MATSSINPPAQQLSQIFLKGFRQNPVSYSTTPTADSVSPLLIVTYIRNVWFLFEVFIYSPGLTVLCFDHELSKSFTCMTAPPDKGMALSGTSSMKSCFWCSFPSALFLSTRLTFNPHFFLLPSLLHQHILFTKTSIYQGLGKADTTHGPFLPPVPGLLLMGACSRKLSVPGSCSPPPCRQAAAQGEMEGLNAPSFIASDQPYLSFPSLVLGLTHLLPFVLTWTLWGEHLILGILEESDSFPVLWKSSCEMFHSSGELTNRSWFSIFFSVKDASKGIL